MSFASDNFNGAGPALGTAVTGQAWSVLFGTVALSSGQAQTATTDSCAVVDLGTGGQNVTVTVSPQAGQNEVGAAIYFRVTDALNWWRFATVLTPTTQPGGVILEKCVGGVVTVVQTSGNTATYTFLQMRVVTAGPSIACYLINGSTPSLVLSASDAFNGSATSHGIGARGGTAVGNVRLDDFSANAPNDPPAAPALIYPTGGLTVSRSNTTRMSWTPSDPNPGDTQSAFDLRYRVVGAGTWTDNNASTPNSFLDLVGGTFPGTSPANYEWQARTYDALGTVGPYSASAFFTVATPPPGPTITAPTDGSTVPTSTVALTWSLASQDAYEVRAVADAAGVPDTGTVYYASGTVESPSGRAATIPLPVNGRVQHLQVRSRLAALWSPWSSVRITASYTVPATPTLAIFTDNAVGTISLVITNPTPTGTQPTVSRTEVWRRESLGGLNEMRLATSVPSGTYVDRTPASGLDYEYRLLAVGSTGATTYSAWTGAATPAVVSTVGYNGGY